MRGRLVLPADRDLDRAFMVMGYFFCLSATFALSRYVRYQKIAAINIIAAYASINWAAASFKAQ